MQLEDHEERSLDAGLRVLQPIAIAGLGLVPDPRLASWSEVCAIGRSFVACHHPTADYQPSRRSNPARVNSDVSYFLISPES